MVALQQAGCNQGRRQPYLASLCSYFDAWVNFSASASSSLFAVSPTLPRTNLYPLFSHRLSIRFLIAAWTGYSNMRMTVPLLQPDCIWSSTDFMRSSSMYSFHLCPIGNPKFRNTCLFFIVYIQIICPFGN